ncbi:ion transporter [Candidatus Woesearchaeota archaeon]|nr:ion transporter [Candidatus Woesearchaeota archaeon]
MVKNNHGSLREKIRFYLIDCNSVPGKLIDIFIMLLNLMICAILVIDTYNISDATRVFFWNLEVVIVFFLIIEYFARLYGARNKLKHIFNIYSVIDLISILPTVLMFIPAFSLNIGVIKILRVFRVLRVFRFLRFTADQHFFFGSITLHLLKVLRLLMTLLIIFFVSSGFFWFSEHSVNPNVENFGDAFYFSVIALTTVGFGDITPLSEGGQWVTVLMILSGIILIPWQVAQVVKEWMYVSNKKDIVCPECGLKYHDKDASHCKTCGHVIYQVHNGD